MYVAMYLLVVLASYLTGFDDNVVKTMNESMESNVSGIGMFFIFLLIITLFQALADIEDRITALHKKIDEKEM